MPAGIVATGRGDRLHIMFEPGVKGLGSQTPVTIERILETEPTGPTPTPIIASPIHCVVRLVVVTIVAVPFSMGVGAAAGGIDEGLVIIKGDTNSPTQRRHEVDVGVI